MTDRKKPGQKYQNNTTYDLKYKPDLKDLQKTAPRDNLCTRCFDIISWKLKFGKYKKPKQPGKCHLCSRKRIFKPYRHICDLCASAKKVCSKCMKDCTFVDFKTEDQQKRETQEKVKAMEKVLDTFKERSKKTIMRLIKDNQIDFVNNVFVYQETGKPVENIQIKNKFKDDDDDLDFDDFSDDSGSYKEIKA